MDGTIRKSDSAPFAFQHLQMVASEISKAMRKKGILEEEQTLTPAQVVLAWLVQHEVSVIPRTSDLEHLKENSAVAISQIPQMSDEQTRFTAISVEALLSGEDVKEDAYVTVTFHAKSKDVWLYWHDHEYGGEIQVAEIKKGESFQESSHPGHLFKIYDSEDKTNAESFAVNGNYGEHHHVEL